MGEKQVEVDECTKKFSEEQQSSYEYYEKGTGWEAKEGKATTLKSIKRPKEKGNKVEHEQT